MEDSENAPQPWADALLAALLFAVDPRGTGLALRAGAGPVREHWWGLLRQQLGAATIRRLPVQIRDDRLLGGLDLTASLQAGRPIAQRGVLAECDGGVLLLPMAERLPASTVAKLVAAMDRGEVLAERDGVALVHAARFGVVALDEGEGADEALSAALADRLAMRVDVSQVSVNEALATEESFMLSATELAAARQRCANLVVPEAIVEALCGAAFALGVDSVRAALNALRVARAHAALLEQDEVTADDASVAARLVLAPRATRLPAPPSEPASEPAAEQPPEPESDPPPPPPPPPSEDATSPDPPPPEDAPEDPPEDVPDPEQAAAALQELLLQAVAAQLPPDLLARLKAQQQRGAASRAGGVAGALQKTGRRGRPVGVRRGLPKDGQRLNVVETLRAAVPWQKLRQQATMAGAEAPVASQLRASQPTASQPRRIHVRADDFHVTQVRQRRETTTIFAVDASGSAALQRLAEAKGAVELLLADCYVRRDKVAVLAFRGRGAELLLPPTRSLVRAKRALAGLPGGGGTPLAAALDAVAAQADAARRRGDTPVVVVLSDGRANVALDGTGGRARGQADALAAARRLAEVGAAVLLIDTASQPSVQAVELAAVARATYLALPQAGARAVAQVVTALSATRT